MSARHHRRTVSRTAHYYTLGERGPFTRRCWLVCHGYGQLAANFIRRFDVVAGPEDYVIAPEGLSRFYWGGLDGPVVASWMTRGDRLDEIRDYCAFLDGLYADEMAPLGPEVRVILLGFSQGCATQVRWLHQSRPRFDHLWLWGGLVPEDLDYRSDELRAYLADKEIHHFLGDADPLVKPEYVELHRAFVKEQSLRVNEHTYPGGHTIVRDELRRFRKTLLG